MNMSKRDVDKRNAEKSWNGHNIPISAKPTPLAADKGYVQVKKKKVYMALKEQKAYKVAGAGEVNLDLNLDALRIHSVDGQVKLTLYKDELDGGLKLRINNHRSGAL